MAAIVIAGEVIAVNPEVDEDIHSELPRGDMILNLEKVGYSSEQATQKTDALRGEGFSRARAWATVNRDDLIALGIGRGYVDALVDVMQADFADAVGVAFARAVNASSVVTDEKAVANIKRGKGCPPLPTVSEDTAYLATTQEWTPAVTGFISWVKAEHELMGEALQAIYENPDIELSTLGIPEGGVLSKALGTLMKTDSVGLLKGHHKRLTSGVLNSGCALQIFQGLVQQYDTAAAKDVLLQAWRQPEPATKLHMVGVRMTEWEKQRKRLVQMGEGLASDEKTRCESLMVLLSGHALTRKIVSNEKLQHGRGLRSTHLITRVLVDTEYWEQEWASSRTEPQEAHAAIVEEKAVSQVEAFVATGGSARYSATGDQQGRQVQKGGKGKGGGGDHVRGKPGYGHCSAHQFLEGGCKDKANCPYWHMPNQEGRFKNIKCPETGKAPCPKFAKTGKCGVEGCQLAHIKVEGAMPKHYTPRSKGQRRVRVRVTNPNKAMLTASVADDPDPDPDPDGVVYGDGDASVLECFIMEGDETMINDGLNDVRMMDGGPKHQNLKNDFSEKNSVKINSILGTDTISDTKGEEVDPEIENISPKHQNLKNEFSEKNTVKINSILGTDTSSDTKGEEVDHEIEDLVNECFEKYGVKINSSFGTHEHNDALYTHDLVPGVDGFPSRGSVVVLKSRVPDRVGPEEQHCVHDCCLNPKMTLNSEEDKGRDEHVYEIYVNTVTHEDPYEKASVVVMDSAASLGVIGKHEISKIINRRTAPTVRVRTAQGITESSEIGDLHTRQGVLTGYLLEQSEYTLWPVEYETSKGGIYTQTADTASMLYENGDNIQYEKRGRLWCLVTTEETARAKKRSLHVAGGHADHDDSCPWCLAGRSRAKPHRGVRKAIQMQNGVTVYIDLMGPFNEDLKDTVYEMLMMEDTYGWIEVAGIPDKSSTSTTERYRKGVQDIMSNTGQQDKQIARVHTDDGTEFKGKMDEYLTENKTKHTTTGGYNSISNPAEGALSRIQGCARAMLAEATGGVKEKYYTALRGLATQRAAYCINRCGTREEHSAYRKAWDTEYEWSDEEHAFGARCLVTVPKPKRNNKMESVVRPAIWVGRQLDTNQHVVVYIEWNPDTKEYDFGSIDFVRTVNVFDNEFPLRMEPKGGHDLVKFEGFIDKYGPPMMMTHDEAEQDASDAMEGDEEYKIKAIIGSKMKGRKKHYVILWDDDLESVTLEPADEIHDELKEEYEERISTAMQACDAMIVELQNKEKMVAELIRKQKQTGTVEEWIPGVEAEFNKVRDARLEDVSEEVRQKVIREKLAMRLRMLLELKKDSRKKGRLVGQGFWETENQYGKKIDSPVASLAAVRMLLFMGDEGEDEVIACGDISGAFLAADEYPEGSEPRYVLFQEYKGGAMHVWRLKGPLYGSKDSPYKWWDSFVKHVTHMQVLVHQGYEIEGESMHDAIERASQGFIKGCDEECTFYNPSTGMRIVLWVDDIISKGGRDETVKFYNDLNETYPLRTWDILSRESPIRYLGIDITEEIINGVKHRYMNQERDVRMFLEDHGIEIAKEIQCPMPDRERILRKNKKLNKEDTKEYRSIVGGLSFYAISLRWDIARSVTRLQEFNQEPTEGCMAEAIRVAMYLGCTSGFRLGGAIRQGENKMEYYTDSDHAGDEKLTQRSHTGVMILMNGIPVHWRSKRQPKTVLSPAHAEIYACSEGLREARLIGWTARDMMIDIPHRAVLQVDNSQVKSFKESTCMHSKLKGMISKRWEWVKELQDDRECEVIHVDTKHNKADILTKCLNGPEHRRQMVQIYGEELPFKRQEELVMFTCGE